MTYVNIEDRTSAQRVIDSGCLEPPSCCREREVFLSRLALNGFLGFGQARGGGMLQVLNIVLPAWWILVSGYIQLWHTTLYALVRFLSPSLSLCLILSHTQTHLSLLRLQRLSTRRSNSYSSLSR